MGMLGGIGACSPFSPRLLAIKKMGRGMTNDAMAMAMRSIWQLLW